MTLEVQILSWDLGTCTQMFLLLNNTFDIHFIYTREKQPSTFIGNHWCIGVEYTAFCPVTCEKQLYFQHI